MQIAETLNEGLRREFSLVIPAADLSKRLDARLAEVSKQIRMPGFRPGKVPANLVRKMHGPALHGEAVQAAVNEGVQQLLHFGRTGVVQEGDPQHTAGGFDAQGFEQTHRVEVSAGRHDAALRQPGSDLGWRLAQGQERDSGGASTGICRPQ